MRITVDNVNYWNKAFTRRRMAANNVDLNSREKFNKYKRDWNYPVQAIQNQKRIVPANLCSNFQSAIIVPIIVGQCFGLIPILGVCEKNAAEVRFKLKSWRFMYTFLTITGQFSMVSFLILRLFLNSYSSMESGTLIMFYGSALVTTMLFVRIAIKWPKLCMEISAVEACDPTADCKLRKKFNTWCFVILFLGLLEHLLSELQGFSVAMDCEPENPLYETFIRRGLSWIFTFLPYNVYIAALYHYINIQCTFNWNFSSLFVICMSQYLTSRLEQVNERIVAAKDKNLPASFWRTLREDHSKAIQLVRKVDKVIGGLIFLVFANNLYFVCRQLLDILTTGIIVTGRCRENDTIPEQRLLFGYEYSIYFAFSFVFLVGRSLAVAFTAARIHSASLEAAFALYDVSSVSYCVEVKRFLKQVHGNTVSISGLQFFKVNRGLILTMAGAIVTYELMMVQIKNESYK